MSVSHLRWHVRPALAAATSSLAGHSSGFVYSMAAAAAAAAASAVASPTSPSLALLREMTATALEAGEDGARGSAPGHDFSSAADHAAAVAGVTAVAAAGLVKRTRRRRGSDGMARVVAAAAAAATGERYPFGLRNRRDTFSSAVVALFIVAMRKADLSSCSLVHFPMPMRIPLETRDRSWPLHRVFLGRPPIYALLVPPNLPVQCHSASFLS